MVWATDRKKSSMYSRDLGSYWKRSDQRLRKLWVQDSVLYIDLVDISAVVEGIVHVSVWEEPVWEERKKYEFGKGEKFIS